MRKVLIRRCFGNYLPTYFRLFSQPFQQYIRYCSDRRYLRRHRYRRCSHYSSYHYNHRYSRRVRYSRCNRYRYYSFLPAQSLNRRRPYGYSPVVGRRIICTYPYSRLSHVILLNRHFSLASVNIVSDQF